MDYQREYLKYKIKYLNLKKIYQEGGFNDPIGEIHDIIKRLPKEAECCYQDIINIYDNLSVGSPIADYMFIVKKTMELYLDNIHDLVKKLPTDVPVIDNQSGNDIAMIYFKYYSEIVENFADASYNIVSMLQKHINDKKKSDKIVYVGVYSSKGSIREEECGPTTTSCQEVIIAKKLTGILLHLSEINKQIHEDDKNKERMKTHMDLIKSKVSGYNEIRRSIDEDKEVKKYTINYEDLIKGKHYQEKEIQRQQMEQIKIEKEKLQENERQEKIERKQREKNRRERQKDIERARKSRERYEQKRRKEDKKRKKKEEWLKHKKEEESIRQINKKKREESQTHKRRIKLDKEIEKMEKKLKKIKYQQKILVEKQKKEIYDLVIKEVKIQQKLNQLNQMKEKQRTQVSRPFNVTSSRKEIGEIYHANGGGILSDDTYTLSTDNSYTVTSDNSYTVSSNDLYSLTSDDTDYSDYSDYGNYSEELMSLTDNDIF